MAPYGFPSGVVNGGNAWNDRWMIEFASISNNFFMLFYADD